MHYTNHHDCEITASGPFTVEEFHTENYFDKLTIDGTVYSGSSSYSYSSVPRGEMTATGTIQWHSDFVVTNKGWKMCGKTPSPAQDCAACVAQFAANGGCEMFGANGGGTGGLLEQSPGEGMIPAGCQECGDAAKEFCQGQGDPNGYPADCDASKYFMSTPYEQTNIQGTTDMADMISKCRSQYMDAGQFGGWSQRYADGSGWCARFTRAPTQAEWDSAGASSCQPYPGSSGHCGAVCGTTFNTVPGGGFGDPSGYGDNYGSIGMALTEERDGDICCHFKCADRDVYEIESSDGGYTCEQDEYSTGCEHTTVDMKECTR